MNGLAIDGSGNLYSASLFGQQVVKLSTTGQPLGGLGTTMPPTAYPSGLLVSGSSILVSTLGNNNPEDPIYHDFVFPGSVQKFDLNGNFQGVLVPNGQTPGGPFQPTSIIFAPTPLAGDLDGDFDVDGADFAVWQDNYPQTNGQILGTGDLDFDGDVDGADFIFWQTTYVPPAPGSSPVPEPTAWMLIASTAVAGLLRLRSRLPRS
jgi:hypothetical protein